MTTNIIMSIDHEFVPIKGSIKYSKNPLERPSISLITGQTGTGKTSYLMNMLIAFQKRNDFKQAIYVTSNKKDKALKILSDDVQVTNDPSELQDFIHMIKSSNEDPKENKSIIILDDIQGSPQFNILKRSSDFLNFVLSHRHYFTWIMLTAQTYTDSFHNVMKKQATILFVFPPRNDAEEEAVLKQIGVDKEKMKKAFALARQNGDHTPVYINKQQPKPRLFLGFNKPVDL